jgi:eukaryotic-like serine/threonine-protein kinase
MTVIGTLISERYRLEEKIGSGGMSSVYRAFDPTLERWVAISRTTRTSSSASVARRGPWRSSTTRTS